MDFWHWPEYGSEFGVAVYAKPENRKASEENEVKYE